MGIRTIGALASYPVEVLASRLGKAGEDLSRKAQGMHDSEVHPYHEARSISTEQTFEENIGDTETLLAELVRMTEKVAFQLREQNKMAGCLAVKIRYPDFDTTTRQAVIPYTFYDDELIPFAREIFNKLYRKGEKVRLLGVRLSELTAEAMQTNLFSDAQKKAVLYKAIDEVKGRFGKSSLTRGGGMNGHGKK
jgi:DNA polymerase-4